MGLKSPARLHYFCAQCQKIFAFEADPALSEYERRSALIPIGWRWNFSSAFCPDCPAIKIEFGFTYV